AWQSADNFGHRHGWAAQRDGDGSSNPGGVPMTPKESIENTAPHGAHSHDAVQSDSTQAGEDLLAKFFVSDEERRVIEESFASNVGGVGLRASRQMVELLAFWVADEEYAVGIVEIQEIIKLPTITEVPRAHSSVVGIISLRGTIVP